MSTKSTGGMDVIYGQLNWFYLNHGVSGEQGLNFLSASCAGFLSLCLSVEHKRNDQE